MLKYDRDRHFCVRGEELLRLCRQALDVLDAVREVVAGEGVAATLSIGVGKDADSLRPCSKTPPWRTKWP